MQMSIIKIKDNNDFVDIPVIQGAIGPQGPVGPRGEGVPDGGNSNDVLVNAGGGQTEWKSLFNLIYPVGSVYISVNDTNPGTLFGGSWQKIEDQFLLGAGDIYTLGASGGEANHTLTVNEMPSHTHNVQQRQDNPTMVSSFYNGIYDPGGIEFILTEGAKTIINRTASDHLFNSSTGGSQSHNNMPPYTVVNIWKRIG